MKYDRQFVTATYKVGFENQTQFVKILKETETIMRSQNLITKSHAYRMSSNSNPELILEIFEWTDRNSFDRAQENPTVLAQWKKYEALWQDGGFGLDKFPESAQGWSQFRSLE
jgi:hypothetical protein